MIGRTTMTVIVFLAVAALAGGCAEGRESLASETREVGDFDRVVLSGIGDLTVTQGEKESLTIEADRQLLPEITTEVRGRTLHISFEEAWPTFLQVGLAKPIRYSLIMKDVSGLELKGAGNINASDIQTERLDLILVGAGSITVDSLDADMLAATLSGAGGCRVKGEATEQTVTVTGAGGYEGGGLETERTDVSVTGLGGATIWATEKLEVTLSGVGGVGYYGGPEVTQRVNGLGKVIGLGKH